MTRGRRTSSSLVIRDVSSYSGPVAPPHTSCDGPQGPPKVSFCSTESPTRGSAASNCSLEMRTSPRPIRSSLEQTP